MIDYFLGLNEDNLRGMGADPTRLPTKFKWQAMLSDDFARPLDQRHFFYLLWLQDGMPVGHSNLAKIRHGSDAHMHLHLWSPQSRQQGSGLVLLKASIPLYFEHFNLQDLYCEPFAENPAPNRTLPRAGFELTRTYLTVPGWMNFEQDVNEWHLPRHRFEALYC